MTGRHETSSYDKFTWGDGTRGASVRIPIVTKTKGRGLLINMNNFIVDI